MTRTPHYVPILLCLLAFPVPAQDASTAARASMQTQDINTLLSRFSEDPDRFTQSDGAELYQATCQACHMEDGRGDEGAGAHPPLAENPKMRSKHFVAGVILTGYHAMPRFGHMMSDEQVAAVTNYVRSHLGNHYTDAITVDDVAVLRPPDDQ